MYLLALFFQILFFLGIAADGLFFLLRFSDCAIELLPTPCLGASNADLLFLERAEFRFDLCFLRAEGIDGLSLRFRFFCVTRLSRLRLVHRAFDGRKVLLQGFDRLVSIVEFLVVVAASAPGHAAPGLEYISGYGYDAISVL